MEQDVSEKLNQIEQKIEETRMMAQRTYKIILWTMIGTVIMFVLPLIALALVIPFFLRTVTSSLNGL